MHSTPHPDQIAAFVSSMPDNYTEYFESTGIAHHTAVALAHGDQLVSAGLFDVGSGDVGVADVAGICLIAEDRPGLLSTISSALFVMDLELVHAQAYTRTSPEGRRQAVDLFWLRPKVACKPLPDSTVVAKLVARIVRLLENSLDGGRERSLRPGRAADRRIDTRVKFSEEDNGRTCVLEVETSDRSGLLLALSSALFNERVQIVSSAVRTASGRVFDRFTLVEFDGSPLNAERRLELQVAVISAIEPAKHSTRPPPVVEHRESEPA